MWQLLHFDINEEREVTVLFDVACYDNLHSSTADDALRITYREHPHVVSFNWALINYISVSK